LLFREWQNFFWEEIKKAYPKGEARMRPGKKVRTARHTKQDTTTRAARAERVAP
jgi:hypothetical protein